MERMNDRTLYTRWTSCALPSRGVAIPNVTACSHTLLSLQTLQCTASEALLAVDTKLMRECFGHNDVPKFSHIVAKHAIVLVEVVGKCK